jgi:hypothetical protein
MNKIQNTLGAVALSLGIAANSAFAEDTSKVVNTTSSAVVAATTSNSGNAGKITQTSLVTPKIDISALVFPKDVKILTDEANKLGLKVETIDDEKKFGSLQDKIIEEEKRLGELREFVKNPKIEKNLITKRGFKLEDKGRKVSLDVERAVTYLRKQEKLAQQVEKDFLIKETKDYVIVSDLVKRAKIKEESTKIKEESTKIQAETKKIEAEIDSKVLKIIKLAK